MQPLTGAREKAQNRTVLSHEGEIRTFESILWASDGSEHADRALRYARELAGVTGARLVAVHVNEISAGRTGVYPVQLDEDEVERKIQAQVKDLRDAGLAASYEQQAAAAGNAAHTLADAARELAADVIVMGTRGHAPIAGLLLGSVTQRLLHIAPCPVLAVPPERTS